MSSELESGALALLQEVKGHFQRRRVAAYLVGGFLRDALLGRTSHDLDLAVSGDALALARDLAAHLGGTFVPLGEAHQVARVVLPGWHLDLASLRGSLGADLRERDFTINALALNLEDLGTPWSETPYAGEERLVDPLGGRGDLAARLVRATGEGVFREDPARLLRAVRLAVTLGFALEQETIALIKRDCPLLEKAAPERRRDELVAILSWSGADISLRLLDSLGLLGALFPELEPARGVEQPKEHCWDVFDHSIESVGAVERLLGQSPGLPGDVALPWSERQAAYFQQEVAGGRARHLLLKLAALFHDLGKPATKTLEGERVRFLGHAQEGAALAQAIMERLRFSARETRLMATMVEQHLRPGQLGHDDLPSRRAIYRYYRDLGEAAVDTLFLNMADFIATGAPLRDPAEAQRHARTLTYVLQKGWEEATVVSPPKVVDGHVLMARFGLTPGPHLRRLLEAVREAQAAGEVSTQEEALALVERLLKEKDAP